MDEQIENEQQNLDNVIEHLREIVGRLTDRIQDQDSTIEALRKSIDEHPPSREHWTTEMQRATGGD